MKAVAVYLRISKDDRANAKRRLGTGATAEQAVADAIQRQSDDVRDDIAELGWTNPLIEFVDRDVSAYQLAERPQFERMMAALASGELAGIACYHPDRLARQRGDGDRVVKLAYKLGGFLLSTSEGQYDLLSERDEDMFVLAIENAYKQSRAMSRRGKREHLARAKAGIPSGGTRPFGWQDDKRSLHPIEAPLLATIVSRVIDGEYLHQISGELIASKTPTVRGGTWTRATVLGILKNPRLCGLRAHNGDIVLDAAGKPVVGQWEPIISVDEFERLQGRLSSNSAKPGNAARRYLLSGFLRCNRDGCLARMVGYPRQAGAYSYGCSARSDGGCGGVSIDGSKSDAIVVKAVLARIAAAEIAPLAGEFSDAEELAAVVRQLDEVQSAYIRRELPSASAFTMMDALDKRVKELRAAERAFNLSQSVQASRTDLPSLVSTWKEMSLAAKRSVIAMNLDAVLVSPARQRGLPFDADRLSPQWC